jgi:hypothetical protein
MSMYSRSALYLLDSSRMAQIGNALLCAAVMTAIWTLIGLPISARVAAQSPYWLWAPAMGWAIHSVVALPLFWMIGMSQWAVLGTTAGLLVASVAGLWTFRPWASIERPAALIVVALLGAALLALVPMMAVLPKPTIEGVTLASPIFDHSKIAMIDEMVRTGVPAGNPFFGEPGTPARVSYYYLWHFSAAAAAVLTGVSGWEADAGLTWFTAFASLLVMIAIAVWICGRVSAAVMVVAIAAAGSLRPTLEWLAPDATPALIGRASGFGGWLFQASWAPQHVASATCVVLACILLSQLVHHRGWFLPLMLGLVAAAGFESSVWIGGIAFALAATAIAIYGLSQLPAGRRGSFLFGIAAAALLAAVLTAPFVYDQAVATAMRASGSPIAIAPTEVLGSAFSETTRRILDLPAYWLIYLPVEFPAFYVAGLIGLGLAFADRTFERDRRQALRTLAILTITSLVASWMLASTIGDNNDLGWRAVLPAVMLLVACSAAAISRWLAAASRIPLVLAGVALLLGLAGSAQVIRENLLGLRKPSERIFAASPEMWAAVRRHMAASERVANNPVFLGDMTPWPVNISWALLADRRSCYAGNELAIPFAPISATQRAEIEAQFVRVFAGEPAPGDIRQLVERYRCDVVVVTAHDGAWARDPFASTNSYRLVEDRPGAWRIYKRLVVQRE